MKGYLPNDTTGDVIFRVQEGAATVFASYILYCIFVKFKTSYDRDLDTVKSYWLIAGAAVLAALFHSNLNRSLVGDYLWAFTQYLESFAIMSQFVLFRNKVYMTLFRKEIFNLSHPTSSLHKEFLEFYS
jgi:hypothetical protein